MSGARFSRHNQPKPCRDCGKMTTERNSGLCARCFDGAGLENEHSDSGHETPVAGCPTCAAEAAEAAAVVAVPTSATLTPAQRDILHSIDLANTYRMATDLDAAALAGLVAAHFVTVDDGGHVRITVDGLRAVWAPKVSK